jgi:hypothetical protein
MNSTKSHYLVVANGHTDALNNYVLDVKPYHTKLSEIEERYEINDDVNVKITENHQLLAFLGADLLESSSPYPGVRTRRSNSWWKELISDGNRTQWQVPFTSVHKFLSHVSQETFIAGENDDLQIPGIENHGGRAFNPRRWDGPSVTNVRKNGEHQQESFDYFLSHGVYTFETRPNQRWIEQNVSSIPAFAESTGILLYQDVIKAAACIRNIERGAYDEWTLTCIDDVNGIVEVRGKYNGLIGTSQFRTTFNHPLLKFDFEPAPGQTDHLLIIGDTFVLTPYHKITVAEDAPQEVWSIIKTNPIVVQSKPSFMPGAGSPSRLYQPALEIHTRSLDRVSIPSSWSITFNGDGTYNLSKIDSVNPYTIENIDLKDGCSFKNDDIHFTIIPTIEGFFQGDTFNFTVGDRVENFLVYGSVSGWQPNAKIGEWYWNGKIGFKIPKLKYFASIYRATVSVSPDGNDRTWRQVVSNAQILTSISFNGAFYVAGKDSIVGSSPDGNTWYQEVVPPPPGELIVIVGENGLIATSSDGEHWVRQATGVNSTLHASTVIPNFLVSKTNSGPIVITQTANDKLDNASIVLNSGNELDPSGISIWKVVGGVPQEETVPFWYDTNTDVIYLYDPNFPPTATIPFTVGETVIVSYSLSLKNCIIAVGDDGTILTSTTGFGWVKRLSGTHDSLNGIAWSNDAIIAVGNKGTILRSNDRINWTPVSFGLSVLGTLQQQSVDFNDIIYVKDLNTFIIVGSNGVIIRSTDGGLTWTRVANTWDNPVERDTGILTSVSYGNGKFVAVGPDGFIASSEDGGISWTRYKGNSYNSIAYGNGLFVAVGGSETTSLLFTKIKDVHSIAEPSVYTITFQPPVKPNTVVKYATVVNNIYGYRKVLTLNEVWEDEFCSFKIDYIPGEFEYQAGDTIRVYLAPEYTYAAEGWYDELNYEIPRYDTGIEDITVPWLYNEEYFPLYHSYGSVIFKNGVNDGDRIIIDKALLDVMRFRINDAGKIYPELASVNDWIPLEFRYFDRPTSPASLYDGKTAHFPDLTTQIEAYLCSDPTVKVFTIEQPRYQCTNRNGSATIIFDKNFFKNYVPFNTKFAFRFQPDASYGQNIRVKVTENLRAYARVRLNLFDNIPVLFSFENISGINVVGNLALDDTLNITLIEGGALPIVFGYDEMPYDIFDYDQRYSAIIQHAIEIAPGVYEYDENAQIILPHPINGSLGTFVSEESTETTGTQFLEDFTLVEKLAAPVFTFSWVPGDNPILVTHNLNTLNVSVTVRDGTNNIVNPSAYTVNYLDPNHVLITPFSSLTGTITVTENQVNRVSKMYDFTKVPLEGLLITQNADEYLITHNGPPVTPTLIVESVNNPGVYASPIPNMMPFQQFPSAISLQSFSFTLPSGFTAPFRLRIT